MKIAIIAPGFTGATLPLAQHLQADGHKVTCYYLVESGSRGIESLDFDRQIKFSDNIVEISKNNLLFKYLNKDVTIQIVPVYRKRHMLSKLFIGKIPALFNWHRIRSFCKYVSNQNFDFINLVYHNDLTLQISRFLKNEGIPFCQSYHEVVKDLINPQPREDIHKSLEGDFPIVIHSQKTQWDLFNFYDIDNLKSRAHLIHFGPFDSYQQYGNGKIVDGVESGYFLFLGRITEYKGLKLLYKAVEMCGIQNLRIVVAGSGRDIILDSIIKDSRFVLINRYIRNDELVYLIKNCKAVVCPYIAASQSGLVQTAFALGKPVIATKVGAFPEIIANGKNGFLVEPNDTESLSRTLAEKEIGNFVPRISMDYNWNEIANTYLKLFAKDENN